MTTIACDVNSERRRKMGGGGGVLYRATLQELYFYGSSHQKFLAPRSLEFFPHLA